jgi:hypothetical protein
VILYCNENLVNVRSDTRDDQNSRVPKGYSKLLNHSNQHWQCFDYDIILCLVITHNMIYNCFDYDKIRW